MDDTFTLPYTPAGENTRQGGERVNLFERKWNGNKQKTKFEILISQHEHQRNHPGNKTSSGE